MTVRPPKALWRPNIVTDPLTASLDHEVRAEKAGTLGRLLERLDKHLDRLNALEADANPEIREHTLQETANALWHVVIQRELCGFGRTQQFLREMKIPREVQTRMGISTPSKISRDSA